MAAITGHVLPDTIDPILIGVNNIYQKTQTINTNSESFIIDVPILGIVSDNLPLDIHPSTPTGHEVGGFGDLFYNKIRIEPIIVNIGSLVSTVIREIIVFNGYFTSKTLEDIQAQDADGISITGNTPPDVYLPLVEKTYEFTVTTEGPTTIDASYLFDFDSIEDDLILQIIGDRVVLFPYLYEPNMNENLQWLTKVLNSNNGTEQRYRARGNPRQSFEVKIYADSNERNRVGNLLYGWREFPWGVPVWSEQRTLLSSITSGDLIINVSTLYGDFRVDSLVIIWESPRTFTVATIESFSDMTITVANEISQSYNTGAIVAPVRIGRLTSDPGRNSTGYNAYVMANFEILDNIDVSSGASDTQYLGLDVMLEQPLKPRDFVTDLYNTRIDLLDYKTGSLEFDSPYLYKRPNRIVQYILEGLEEVWEFRRWLHRRAGMLTPFWMPTFENDLILLSTGALTTSIEVKNDEYENLGYQRDHIAIFLFDDTVLLRAVTDIEINIDNNLDLTLDSSISIDASEIDFISYNGIKRLNADKISLNWLANNVAIVKIPILELEP